MRLREIAPQVDVAFDGAAGYRMAIEDSYDLLVLDLALPEVDGMEICARIRARRQYTPIIVITARATERDKIAGLDAGADDYVTKPFSIEEFLSRVRALLRRTDLWRRTAASEPVISAGPLLIDVVGRTMTNDGRAIDLTAKEFDLLLVLARSPGKVISRAELLRDVWGYTHEGYRHTVDTHMSRLRGKIERAAEPSLIQTVWGVGYRFALPDSG